MMSASPVEICAETCLSDMTVPSSLCKIVNILDNVHGCKKTNDLVNINKTNHVSSKAPSGQYDPLLLEFYSTLRQ